MTRGYWQYTLNKAYERVFICAETAFCRLASSGVVQGLQLSTFLQVRRDPKTAPCFDMTFVPYSLHVGWWRQYP